MQSINCKRPPSGFVCERCFSGDKCGYSVHYTEGSSIQGHVITDYAHFWSAKSAAHGARGAAALRSAVPSTTRVFFGCQMQETGMFFKQEADGIMGMQPPRARTRGTRRTAD